MKILQIANGDFFSSYGGGQVYVKNLVDEMINQGMDVVVFSKNNKIKKHQIIERKYKNIFLYEYSTLDTVLLKNRIKQLSPDILHIHTDKACFSNICKELSIPCVITAHHGGITCPAGALLNYKDEICKVKACQKECFPCVLKNTKYGYSLFPILKKIPESWRLKISHFFKKIPFIHYVSPIAYSPAIIEGRQVQWKLMSENVTLMIAPSHAIAENMMLNGLNAQKIEIVPHGIPMNLIKNTTFVGSIPKRKMKFFYVGRVSYVKGIHILLEAFVKLKTEECELHIVGGVSGEEYQRSLIKKYSGNKNVVFHGKISPEEVALKIREFDMLVHPTICLEVFGLDIAEALAEGKPVIATMCGGAEMQIQEGENGLLVMPNSVEELFHAMEWAVNHPEDIHRMSKHAISGVISIQEHVDRIKESYHKIL